MIDSAALLADLKRELKSLEADLGRIPSVEEIALDAVHERTQLDPLVKETKQTIHRMAGPRGDLHWSGCYFLWTRCLVLHLSSTLFIMDKIVTKLL